MSYNQHIFDLEKKEIRRDFESAYVNYENVYPSQFELNNPKFRLVLDKIKSCSLHSCVLDIGCGYGAFVDKIKNETDACVTGIDISPTAIKKGKKIYGDSLGIHVGDIRKTLEFKKETFDYVICFGVITWLLDSVEICLSNITNVMKQNACLAISMGYGERNVFFREIISSEQDFLNLLSKEFVIEDFFIHYHELGIGKERSQNFNLSSQYRDLIAFCRRKNP